MEIRISIQGNRVELRLLGGVGGRTLLGQSAWEDRRDLSSKLFVKMEALLRRKGFSLAQVKKISFYCDSPYFSRQERWQEMKLENIDSTGKCGFTAWQTGEIISRVMNFALQK